jgi:hypothetical protein
MNSFDRFSLWWGLRSEMKLVKRWTALLVASRSAGKAVSDDEYEASDSSEGKFIRRGGIRIYALGSDGLSHLADYEAGASKLELRASQVLAVTL